MAPEKNIRISGTELPSRLRELRETRNLARADLAQRAGLSERTVRAIEKGLRPRVQEKTLMLLAHALGVPYRELLSSNSLEPETAPALSRTHGTPALLRYLAAGLAVLLLGTLGAGYLAVHNVRCEIAEGTLIARDGILGLRMWERSRGAKIVFCERSPWSDEILLVGREGGSLDGGGLRAVQALKGTVLWAIHPRVDPFALAFGMEELDPTQFGCSHVEPVDIDGDGKREVAAYFSHIRYCPACLCLVDRRGCILGQYSHRGFLYDFHSVDLDGDGREEFLAGGINNASQYRGGTIILLDQHHWGGAAIDQGQSGPRDGIADSSRVRVVFPHYGDPFMTLVGDQYIGIDNLMVSRDGEGDILLLAAIGAHDCDLLLELDAGLRPRRVDICDAFLSTIEAWPDSVRARPNPADARWREHWLRQHVRFEACF